MLSMCTDAHVHTDTHTHEHTHSLAFYVNIWHEGWTEIGVHIKMNEKASNDSLCVNCVLHCYRQFSTRHSWSHAVSHTLIWMPVKHHQSSPAAPGDLLTSPWLRQGHHATRCTDFLPVASCLYCSPCELHLYVPPYDKLTYEREQFLLKKKKTKMVIFHCCFYHLSF